MGKLENAISQNVMTLKNDLEKLVETASKVQKEPYQKLRDKLSRKQLRLRPSVGSFSLVSYAAKTPQLGSSNLNSISDLERAQGKKLSKPRRDTPEKELQSWFIREALHNGGIVNPLNDVLKDGQYWFVSDEIAIAIKRKPLEKLVADLLLVKVDAEGLAHLVNVELKYDRLTQAFDQVMKFRAALEHPELQGLWKQFAETMTGKQFRWQPSQKAHGIVVWPRSNDSARALANEKTKKYERVDLVGFKENYHLEREPAASV
jgi:hypothetical protein